MDGVNGFVTTAQDAKDLLNKYLYVRISSTSVPFVMSLFESINIKRTSYSQIR